VICRQPPFRTPDVLSGRSRKLKREVSEKFKSKIDASGARPCSLGHATHIVLIDMSLWMHYWLAAERQIAWAVGSLEHSPGGLTKMPSTEALFQAIWDVEQSWMPEIRALCAEAEQQGKAVVRLASVEEIDAFSLSQAVAAIADEHPK